MVKDKYLKESQVYQNLLNTAKKYGVADYIPGQSFDSYKDKMTAEDYETSQKLLNYYTSQQNLTNDYNYNNANIENNRNQEIEKNRIARTKAMHYLPEYLKSQGLGGLGVSESSIIDLNNNFRNASSTINNNAESLKANLLKNYQDNMRNLDNDATTETSVINKKYEDAKKEEKTNLYNGFIDKLNYGEFNTSTELEESYNNIKDKLNDSQKSILEDKIDYYKNNLAQKEADAEYEEQKKNVESETKKQAEIDERVLSGKEYVSYDGNNYQIKSKLDTNANELRNNNSFSEQLKNKCGTTNPFDTKIPNGTTFEIKVDAAGKDNPSAWNWVAGVLTLGYSELAMGSIYRKYVTYYNGNWYVSEKK